MDVDNKYGHDKFKNVQSGDEFPPPPPITAFNNLFSFVSIADVDLNVFTFTNLETHTFNVIRKTNIAQTFSALFQSDHLLAHNLLVFQEWPAFAKCH